MFFFSFSFILYQSVLFFFHAEHSLSKWYLFPIIRSRVSRVLLTDLGIRVTSEGTHIRVKHWKEWCFTHVEKRQTETSFSSVSQPVRPGGLPWKPTQGEWPAHVPLVLPQKYFTSPLQGTDMGVRLARGHMRHILK